MAAAPLTPQEDTNDPSHNGEPRYDEVFEKDVANVVVSPPPADGIVVEGDTSSHEAPDIQQDELPLPLSDPRRKFRSPIPGIRLTHPGGMLEGGPSQDDDITEAQKFIDHFQIRNNEELQQKMSQEMQNALDELRSRASARQNAMENNEKIDRELQQLVAQREVEVRVWQREKERKGGAG